MARRSDHSKEEITEMVLLAAEKIVDQSGYQGLSARKIATEIGYTVGTLYLIFKNLDELVLSVNARTLEKIYDYLTTAISRCDSPRQCILIMGRAYLEFATQNPNRWNMIYELVIPSDTPIPIWYESRVEQIFELIEYQLARLLTHRSDQQIAEIARTLWCGVHGICILARTNKLRIGNISAVQNLTDSLINNFLTGVTHEVKREKLSVV